MYKILHLEPTDVCNLACPVCAREIDLNFNKNKKHHLTISQIHKYLQDSDISQLDKMFMCGSYGDPAAGKHTLEIYKHFRKVNPTITLGMNTNGSLKSIDWWVSLASILNTEKDYVVFSIDGLSDTNHIYRINSNWEKLIQNISAFISSGGRAHWDMLVYQHNEHQVDECRDLAQKLGFKWFRTKVSSRQLVNNLQYPSNWTKPVKIKKAIQCIALEEQSLYINAQGVAYPCCWLSTSPYNLSAFNEVKKSWDSISPNRICEQTCGAGNSFASQWTTEIEF